MGKLNEMKNSSFYITDKLTDSLKELPAYGITFVSAPSGFGKTIALKDFLRSISRKCIWINVASDSKDIFWADFCDIVSEIDRDRAQELRSYDYPQNEKNIAAIRNVLKRLCIPEETYLAIDNYHLVENPFFDLLISYMVEILPEDIHVIFLTQGISSSLIEELIGKRKILSVTKEAFAFSPKDIVTFFSLHELKISEEQAQKLYDYTEGWIPAINLQMIHYQGTGSLEDYTSLEALVDTTLWDQLRNEERKFLVSLIRLDGFGLKEAKLMAGGLLKDAEVEKLLAKIVLIRFDASNRKYYIHNVLKDYLEGIFADYDKDERNEVIIATGKILEGRGKLYDAYRQYYEAGAWELIYQSVPEFDKLYPYVCQENKNFFLALANECPEEIASRYYYFPIILCLVLFMYNEKDRLIDCLLNIVYSIEESKELNDRQKKNLLGTVYFVRGFTEFNNITVMDQFYRKSLDYGGLPVIDLTSKTPFTFGCPSVLHMFCREQEPVDETQAALENCLPNYYRLSEGHGKGAEAFMKAEILFNRGDLEGAETLCHKSLYMADSRSQTDVILGSLLLLARKSIFDGDYDAFHESMDAFRKKVVYVNGPMDVEYVNMIELCEGYLHIILDEKERLCEWLTSWESIENRLNLISMSYASIIYGRYLYLNGEYQKFLGISGQFLGMASIFSMTMCKIYIYLYIAMCHKALDNSEKTDKFLRLAMELACEDSFVMPFVENMDVLENEIEPLSMETSTRELVKKIKSVYRKYSAGKKSIGKNARNRDNFGLTTRELEVAKLAAQRLSNKEIADQLFIAESTVKSNMKIIFNKLSINSRSELSGFFN